MDDNVADNLLGRPEPVTDPVNGANSGQMTLANLERLARALKSQGRDGRTEPMIRAAGVNPYPMIEDPINKTPEQRVAKPLDSFVMFISSDSAEQLKKDPAFERRHLVNINNAQKINPYNGSSYITSINGVDVYEHTVIDKLGFRTTGAHPKNVNMSIVFGKRAFFHNMLPFFTPSSNAIATLPAHYPYLISQFGMNAIEYSFNSEYNRGQLTTNFLYSCGVNSFANPRNTMCNAEIPNMKYVFTYATEQ